MKRTALILICLLIPSMAMAVGKASAGPAEDYQAAKEYYAGQKQAKYIAAIAKQIEILERIKAEAEIAEQRLKALVQMGAEEWWVKEYLATDLW